MSDGLVLIHGRFAPNGDVVEIPSDMIGDSHMVKVVPGESPPPGAKPWYYRGEKFWIIPIAAMEQKPGR